jgi:tRNA threonylcarbamoyladenosine biosynthesis protein TsaB
MVILSLCTSTDAGSVAVHDSDRGLLSEIVWKKPFQHGEVLVSSIEQCLKLAGVERAQINLIAVDKGPGSFTGARVSVNVARTLAYGLGIPVAALSSLEILSFQASAASDLPVVTVVDAHKELFYTAFFPKPLKRAGKPPRIQALSVDQLAKTVKKQSLVVGPLTDEQTKTFKKAFGKKLVRLSGAGSFQINEPRASSLAALLMASSAKHFQQDWTNIEPLYIRAPEAYEKLAAGQLPDYHMRRRQKR